MLPDDASAPAKFPSRRELQQQRKAQQNTRKGAAVVRSGATVVRGVLLGALAAATIAAPLSGFVGPESTQAVPTKVGVITAGDTDSWRNPEVLSAPEAVDLARVETAASRQRVRNPLSITNCVPGATSAANGDRVVTESAPIVWPLMEGTFSFASPFGTRFHPILGISRLHAGVDLSGPLGTPIYAVSDGVVVDSSTSGGYGYWLRIRHEYPNGEVYYSGYAHMYAQDVLVHVGDQVKAGQQVAAIGNTGYSTGPHLHFEVHDSFDTPFDPIPWLEQHARQIGQGCG